MSRQWVRCQRHLTPRLGDETDRLREPDTDARDGTDQDTPNRSRFDCVLVFRKCLNFGNRNLMLIDNDRTDSTTESG